MEKESPEENATVVVKSEQIVPSESVLTEQKEAKEPNTEETAETEKKEEGKESESSTADKKEVC